MSVLGEEALQTGAFGPPRTWAFGPAGAWHRTCRFRTQPRVPSFEGGRRASTLLARPIHLVVKNKTALLLALACLACAVIAGDSSGAASSYPTPLNLRSAASSVTGSWTLDSNSGATDATTANVSIDDAVDNGWYVFAPGTSSTTRLNTIPTGADGTGWIVDPAGGASGFPAGNWTFTVATVIPGGILDPGTAVLTVGMWKGTISSGVFTPTAAILGPTDDPAAQDLRSDFNVTTSVTFSLPKFSLGAGETLFVELWRHQVGGISDAMDANRELDLSVNDGVSAISHPVADSTAPTHSLAVTGLSGNTVFDSGSSVLYYDGSSDGSFTLADTIDDVGSGSLQVTYPLVSTSGWTHPAETVATGPDYTSATYSWTAGSTTSPGGQSIVAEDQALQTSTATLTLTNDTTGPIGQSVTLSGGPDYSTASVPLTLVDGSDAGAGLDSASGVVERASATAANGSCGSFGSYAAVTLTSGADTTVSAGNCYRYRYLISDLLGNQSASSDSADAVVDTTAPTVTGAAPTEVTGAGDQYWDAATGTVWFRPAAFGSFILNATPTDAESGIAQVAFPDVSATTGWSGSTGGTDTTAPFSSPVAYTWTASALAPGAKQLTVTSGTGLTGTGAITFSADSTPPTGQTIALTGGPWFPALSVPLTIGAGTDTGSGIDAARGVVERASAPLTNGVCGTFGSFAAVTLTGSADTSVASGNCYRYQYKATDNVGNVSTVSTATADAKVDATPPTVPTLLFSGLSNAAASGSVVYYRAGGAGSFTVTAASADADSGIASYTFPIVPNFAVAGSGSSRTYTFAAAPSAPLAPLVVTVTNGAGQISGAASFTLVPDPIAPTVSVLCNGRRCTAKPYPKSVVITMSASDGLGSGVSTIRYTTNGADPTLDGGSEYVRAFTVQSLTKLKARAYDKAGNVSGAVSVTVRSLADRLVFGAPSRANVKAAARYLQAKVSSSRRATVAAVMSGKGLKKPERWRFTLGAGASIVQLRLPTAIKRPGSYTMTWNVASGAKKSKKTTRVTLAKPPKKKPKKK